MKLLIRIGITVALLAVAGIGVAAWLAKKDAPEGTYRTAPVKRADIVATITATGTVVPEDVVDIGSQVNGQIASFGLDVDGKSIDYRSTVKKDMVLAHIDEVLFAADVSTAQAQLAQANASVTVSEANRDQAQAKLDQAQRDWDRAQKLSGSPALAQVDFDAARSAFEQARAALAVSEANIVQAHASVASAEAGVQRAQRSLTFCTIHSPVDGVILDRRVEIGQTVVASLNAPSLFLIAKDLRRMKVLVQVNEADIGHVEAGESVTFTTDANPGDVFKGEVRKVRLNATLTQNVVTYTVEITTDNADLELLPYLTANVTFEISRRDNVLSVPNAALRWTPKVVASSTGNASAASGAASTKSARGPDRAGGANSDHSADRSSSRGPAVWVLDGETPRRVPIETGTTDGNVTEVVSGELTEDMLVIVGDRAVTTDGSAGTTTKNPFAPVMPGRGGQRGGR